MIYRLVDDYDYTTTGIIETDKSYEEVQTIVDEARNTYDGYWDEIMYQFKQNGIRYLSVEEIDRIIY